MRTVFNFFIITLTIIICINFSNNSIAKERKKDLSKLQALSKIKVTLATKQPEDPFDVPAAIYVISREDIRRSGATNLPDVLRIVPGLQVATAGSNWHAVSARGFNDTIANKLLVMIDGRTVYNTLFSGTWWDEQEIIMDDIKQIEIIKGSGAALWGANAVNGIINIVTENTANTIGTQVTVLSGNTEDIETVRVGGQITPYSNYRIYAKRTDRKALQTTSGTNAKDAWDITSGGFRIDYAKDKDSVTLQADAYNSNIDRTATLPILTAPFSEVREDDSNLFGGNILARWEHKFADNSSTSLQTYVSHTERNFSVSREQRTVFDLDFQHSLPQKNNHEITWGLGYRFVNDQEPFAFYFPYTPENSYENLYSGFIQDKISLIPKKLFLTAGIKLEHHKRSGFEYQPSARIAWHPTPNQTIWSAVSRAIRSPSRFENDGNQILAVIPGDTPGFVRWVPNLDFESEELISYELGYRIRPTKKTFFDIATFVNHYDDLRTFDAGTPFSTGSDTALPLIINNKGEAESYGIEANATYDATNRWKLSASYTFLVLTTHIDADSTDTALEIYEETSPKHQFNINSKLDITDDIEFDNTLYYVSDLDATNIPSYLRFDSRIAWRPMKGVELSIVGQNLFDERHPEFAAIPVLESVEVGRSVYGQISLRF